jgi:DNA repair protein RadC
LGSGFDIISVLACFSQHSFYTGGQTVNEERRRRLEAVIHPLTRLDDFSADEAKQSCDAASGRYVARMLRQLVREGLLIKQTVNRLDRYRWNASKGDAFVADQWIEQQIHGIQVRESPVSSRPRERLLRCGVSSLTDADLLAILIRVGVPKESAVVGGQRIANRFADKMEALSDCSQVELRQISPAATQASYAQIMAGIELGRRIALIESTRRAKAIRINSTRAAVEFCRHRFARLATDGLQEQFHIVTLDTKHKPIQTHCITVGTLDASLVHPREVFRPAIRDAASAILLVHNHPSGDPTPSREDHRVTQQLTDAGHLLGIEVLDHIVVAREDCLSIRESS